MGSEQSKPKGCIGSSGICKKIAETAVHEKIGHGFLSMFSAFGQTLNELGLRKVKDAEQFGLEVPYRSLIQAET